MARLRITLAQLNYTIADIAGNLERMHNAARDAHAQGTDLIVFSELSLTAYYPGDLLNEGEFLNRVDEGIEHLKTLTHSTPGMHWVVGAPTRRNGPGKRLFNSLLVVKDGFIVLQYAKQLLPTYNVFDEHRHFEPGNEPAPTLLIGNARIGFLICEDAWNDEAQNYVINPFMALKQARPDLVVSINASPSSIERQAQRQALFCAASRNHDLPLVFVNQVGGQDQLVFDGHSFAITPQQGVVFEAVSFKEETSSLEFADGQFYDPSGQILRTSNAKDMPRMEFYRQQIILGIQDYARRCGFSKAVVGSSGGIDSALTLYLACAALGAENVIAVTMPSKYSSNGSVDDSHALCQNLGIHLFEHPIRDLATQYGHDFAQAFGSNLEGLAAENLQARIRGTILMEYSNAFGHLLLTTGNKSEISVGYCTLYGDTNGGLGPIGDLYKTEVFELCRHINAVEERELIPQAIIDKEPSAELAPNQRDSDSLPPYPVLDVLLKYLIEGALLPTKEHTEVMQKFDELLQTADGPRLLARVRSLIARSEYKRRQAPPILRVRPRAFGTGRQMPISALHL